MDQQQRNCGRRHTWNACCTAHRVRPRFLQPLTHFDRQAADLAIVDVLWQPCFFVPALPFDLVLLPVDVAGVLTSDADARWPDPGA